MTYLLSFLIGAGVGAVIASPFLVAVAIWERRERKAHRARMAEIEARCQP